MLPASHWGLSRQFAFISWVTEVTLSDIAHTCWQLLSRCASRDVFSDIDPFDRLYRLHV